MTNYKLIAHIHFAHKILETKKLLSGKEEKIRE